MGTGRGAAHPRREGHAGRVFGSAAASPAVIQPGRVSDLPNLIDLAQQTNPETRARVGSKTAAAAGSARRGTYLPTLGAIGMASYAHLPDHDKMGPFLVRTGVLEPLLRLAWLLLDFGRATLISTTRPRPCSPPICSSIVSSKA